MEEIGCSEEEEETQEDSRGCSKNLHRCKGYVESRGTRRGYVQRSHTCSQEHERYRPRRGGTEDLRGRRL